MINRITLLLFIGLAFNGCGEYFIHRNPIISVTIASNCNDIYEENQMYIYISRVGTEWDSYMYVDVGGRGSLVVFEEGKYNITATATSIAPNGVNYEVTKSMSIDEGEDKNVTFSCE